MELFGGGRTNFDFLGKRHIFFGVSGVLLVTALVALFGGVRKGIDFTGGTEIQVRFAAPPDIDRLRAALGGHELGDATLQSIGRPEDHELLIRIGLGALPETAAAASEQVRVQAAVSATLNEVSGGDLARPDLNALDERGLTALLQSAGVADPGGAARAVLTWRAGHGGLITSADDLRRVPGLDAAAAAALEGQARFGSYAVRRVDFVGPRVGEELARKAMLAMVLSLAGMLVYIWWRFQNVSFALGGIVALAHDGLIAAGLFDLWGGSFDLTIVAAILTLLGYSLNDTIVIFDRVRENLRAQRGPSLEAQLNNSINQTLSRTILTSLLTLFSVIALCLFGGETLRGFSFLLLFGIIIGSYSTIFIASPVVLYAHAWVARRGAARSGTAAAAGPAARPAARRPPSVGR